MGSGSGLGRSTLNSQWLSGTPRQETASVLALKNINGHTSVNSFNFVVINVVLRGIGALRVKGPPQSGRRECPIRR